MLPFYLNISLLTTHLTMNVVESCAGWPPVIHPRALLPRQGITLGSRTTVQEQHASLTALLVRASKWMYGAAG